MKLFDPIRKKWVVATPEERVRQAWVQSMVGQLEFPRGLISIEGSWSLAEVGRRFDLLVWRIRQGKMEPLLLLEFKSQLVDEDVFQLQGYNSFVKAPFWGIADAEKVQLFWVNREGVRESISYMPSYENLVGSLCS
jgi:hypothetical protein